MKPRPVQVVLTFDDRGEFDATFAKLTDLSDRVTKLFSSISASKGGEFVRLQGLSSDVSVTWGDDHNCITISRFDTKMQRDGFRDVLANALIFTHHSDAYKAIENHTCALFIEVFSGSTPCVGNSVGDLGDDFMEMLGPEVLLKTGALETRDAYLLRTTYAKKLATFLMDMLESTAVHWGQSHQAYTAQKFRNRAENPSPIPLLTGYFPMDIKEHKGQQSLSIKALGSQDLLGKMVVFDESCRYWLDNYKMIVAFVSYCFQRGEILPDVDTFGVTGKDLPAVRVTYVHDYAVLRYVDEGPVNAAPLPAPDKRRLKPNATGPKGRRKALSFGAKFIRCVVAVPFIIIAMGNDTAFREAACAYDTA